MATIEDLRQLRWKAIKSDVDYNPDAGIYKFWIEHPEIGSPVSNEMTLDDGRIAQAFANAIVIFAHGEIKIET